MQLSVIIRCRPQISSLTRRYADCSTKDAICEWLGPDTAADLARSLLLFNAPPVMALVDLAFTVAAIPDLDHPLADDRHYAASRTRCPSCFGSAWSAARQYGGRARRAGLEPVTQPGQANISRQRGSADRDRFAKLLPRDWQIAARDCQARVGNPGGQLALHRRPAFAAETVIDRIRLLARWADALDHRRSPQGT